MRPGCWLRISGDSPDLGLPATPPGSQYLAENDPARDAALNPPAHFRERLRRLTGRAWRAPWSGRTGFRAITEAWNGAVFASRFGASGGMILFGGGHDDYYGSDVHSFELATREWQRLADGYTGGSHADYGAGAVYPDAAYPDGSPLPPHTYGYVQYDAHGNNYLLLKGQSELGPDVRAVPVPHLFNLDMLEWRHGPRHPRAVLSSGGCSCWDPGRDLLWGHAGDDGGGNGFVAYRPTGENADGSVGEWVHFSPSKLPGEANHNAMVFHPGHDRIVIAAHRRDGLLMLDPGRPDSPPLPLPSSGTRPAISEYASLEYSPVLDSLVYYSACDGADVFAIACDETARWRCLTSRGALDPVADAAEATHGEINRSHTFGRFRVANFGDVDIAILVRHVDSPVYCMRLPDASDCVAWGSRPP